MNASSSCISLIKQFEGCKLRTYADDSPRHIPTVGYGHTASCLQVGDVITQAQAEAFLFQDVQTAARGVFALTGTIPQCQFDALCSFAYNAGVHNLAGSTLLKKLKAEDTAGAALEFPKWNHAGAGVLPGLTRRRAAEMAMFNGEETA